MLKFGFHHLLGNDYAKRYFLSLRENVPQSIIITGEEGVGKLSFAEQFSLMLLCENPNENGPCGLCNSCLSYKEGHNPNIFYWFPKGQNTTIDQMRSLKEMSMYSPTKGKYKINIIQKGDTLNEEASNSILKIVEEPPSYLINILLFNNPHNILQTIRSRSIVVNLNSVSVELIKDYLINNYDIDQNYGDFVSKYSMGSLGKALLLVENEQKDAIREIAFDIIRAILNKPMELLYLADLLSDKKNYLVETGKKSLDEVKNDVRECYSYHINCETSNIGGILFGLDMLSFVFRDILAVLSSSDKELINIDKKNEIVKFSEKFSEEYIINSIKLIWQTKDKIKANINATIGIQSLLCKLLIDLKTNNK